MFSTGPAGGYRPTRTVRNAAGRPFGVAVPACSPNGDGVKDRCAWTAGPISGWTITSLVTRGTSSVDRQTGGGARTWNGHGRAPNQFEPLPATATGTRRRSR